MIGYYGINVWVGKLLVDRGISVSHSIALGVIMTAAAVPSGWVSGRAMERYGRKVVFILALCSLSVAAFIYGNAHSVVHVVLAGSLMQFLLTTTATALYAYTPELFPTSLRATGLGTSSTIGRIAAVAGPILVPILISTWSYAAAFLACSLTFLLAAALLTVFGPETRGLSIERAASPFSRR